MVMIDKELLKAINITDIKSEEISNDGLTESLELLEKAHSKLHNALIMTRMKKLMRDFGDILIDKKRAVTPGSENKTV